MAPRPRSIWLLIGVVVVLLSLGGCRLLRPTATPTQPTLEIPTNTSVPASPTAPGTPVPASPTPTELADVTPAATATLLPTETSPAVTFTPSAAPGTPLPATPTPTAAPTHLPPTSTATRTPTPTATSTPTLTPTPVVVITDWRGEYFPNPSLQGTPRAVRNDLTVDLTLPLGTVPATGMPGENWSARWTRTWNFAEGNYRFRLLVDDGARLWVAGRLLIDAWSNGPAREFTGDLYLKGDVPLRLEYYNGPGDARVRLNWERVTLFQGWLGSYYPVQDLTGLPLFQRDDPAIDFVWGLAAPRADLPADGFSVRWTRSLTFAQPGLYRFRAESDDGVRLWVDGKLVISGWRDGHSVYEGVASLTSGKHSLQLDYYERWGEALAKLTWASVQSTATPTNTPTSTPTSTPLPPTATPRPTNTPTTPAKPTATPTSPAVEPTPTATSPAVEPTATATSPAVEPTVTATHTPEPTATPTARPTDTATPSPTPSPTDTPPPPTDTPAPGRPAIALRPDKGPLGVPFEVSGRFWPAGVILDLFLLRPLPESGAMAPVAQVVADAEGKFSVELVVPEGQGWEGLPSAVVLARSQGGEARAQASYRILPALTKIRFRSLPADQDRFALPEPAYLVLESEAAWQKQFGPEPPPATPAVNWRRELLVAVMLGMQPDELEIAVASVVQRDTVVSVWLDGLVPDTEARDVDQDNRPRTMIRVQRNALKNPEDGEESALIWAFLDASGRLLAQGPIGGIEPPSPAPLPEARALGVPQAVRESAQAEPTVEALAVQPTVVVEAQAEGVQPAAVAELPETPVAEAAAAEPGVAASSAPETPAALAAAETLPTEVGPLRARLASWPWPVIGLGLIAAGSVALLAALGVYLGRRKR